MLALLLALLSILLHGVYRPDQTLFSNDGPLGRLMTEGHQLPGRFTGCWEDLNNIGFNGGTASPSISLGLQFLLKPIWFSKLYALVALVILGLGAWCFFAQSRLTPAACILGGMAAALNSCFFSTACWGMAAHPITAGMCFFALAALTDTTSCQRWLRVVLAGLAVGMGVMEGADVGAIFSLYVAAFILYQAWISTGSLAKRAALGFSRVALVALCAALMAAPAISSLIDTNIKGVAGTQQDTQTKKARWDWATQWSLPIRETTGLIVPGLFGYRMDTPAGGCYWGETGRDPAVSHYIENGRQGSPPTQGLMRFSGGGSYAGVLVAVLAFWAVAQSLRSRNPVFNLAQRRWLWFWSTVIIVSILLCFGRFAPFYRFVYALPYFSTIRNPVKFIYLVSFAIITLFAYGIDGLGRKYMQSSGTMIAPRWTGLKASWLNVWKMDKSWLYGFGIVLGLSLLAWMQYDSERQTLVDYLQSVFFNFSDADTIASFSIRQVGWFILYLLLSFGLITAIFGGVFSGARARWGGVALGLLLLADLGRANLPWIVYWNYPEKYASNPIIDLLRTEPYQHRVVICPGQTPPEFSWLNRLYKVGWTQQLFPYYNIQALDISNMPRKPTDLVEYQKALKSMPDPTEMAGLLRYWQLTNARFVLGYPSVLEPLNQAIRQTNQQFRIMAQFNIVPKPGRVAPLTEDDMTAVPDNNGPYVLLEFTGALPRVKLYSNWESNTNAQDLLEQLVNPDFDPNQSVLVASELPAALPSASRNPNAGTVKFASYSSKTIVLKSDAPSPTVLLLNDHYDPNWKVSVDGRPEPLLRCNFIMRGVYLNAGTHTVEFKLQPHFKLLYLCLSVEGLGLLLLGLVVFSRTLLIHPIQK